MAFSFIQVFAIVFALFAFSRVFLRMKEKKLSILEFMFWAVIWVALILMALFPEALTAIADRIGIQSGTGLVVYTGIIVLFYLMFRLYVKLDTMQQEMTIVQREVVLRKALQQKSKKQPVQKGRK